LRVRHQQVSGLQRVCFAQESGCGLESKIVEISSLGKQKKITNYDKEGTFTKIE
jgi:hypothetical protein